MLKIKYTIKQNRKTRIQDVEDIEVDGYQHSPFIGIRKRTYGTDEQWSSWEIDHIPTGQLMKGGLDRRKDAVAVADELVKAISKKILSESDPEILTGNISDDVKSYIGWGLRDTSDKFIFRTLKEFKKNFLS